MSGSREQERRLKRAAEYRSSQRAGASDAAPDAAPDPAANAGSDDNVVQEIREAQEAAVKTEAAIRQAKARGDFDNLSLAGKPIPGLGKDYDPDWWIKGLIEREQITGLAPEPFLLRKEDAELDARLAAQSTERAVREIVQDFNARVINARRQLLGGPPVVTPTRDLEEEAARWRASRSASPDTDASEREEQAKRRPWWRRRSQRRLE